MSCFRVDCESNGFQSDLEPHKPRCRTDRQLDQIVGKPEIFKLYTNQFIQLDYYSTRYSIDTYKRSARLSITASLIACKQQR